MERIVQFIRIVFIEKQRYKLVMYNEKIFSEIGVSRVYVDVGGEGVGNGKNSFGQKELEF